MQQLTESDYLRIRKTINAFHQLGLKGELTLEEKLGKAWGDVFQQFVKCCQANAQWRSNYRLIKKYQEVVNFDMDSHFEITLGDSDYKLKVFNANIKNEYINSHENLEKYRQQTKARSDELKRRRFVPFRKFRLEHLKNRFQTIENEANLYAYWQKKDAEKNDYLEHQTDKYNQARVENTQIESTLANDIIVSALKHKSILAYRDIDSVLHATFEVNNNNYDLDSRPLNQALNQLRQAIFAQQKNITSSDLSTTK